MADWREAKDPETGDVYYYNKKTRETTWDVPPEYEEYQRQLAEAKSQPAEPVKAEPVKAEPVKAEPVKAEPVKTAPVATKTAPVTTKTAPVAKVEAAKAAAAKVTAQPVKISTTYDGEPELPPPVASSGSLEEAEDTKYSGICSACNKEIRGPCFKQGPDKKFHPKCFVCASGGHSLAPSFQYHVYQEKVYCPEHYVDVFNKICHAQCGEPIKTDFIQVNEHYYHPTCWKCKDCAQVLTTENHGTLRGEFYCKSCLNAWMSQDKDLKAKAAHDKLQERLAAMKMAKAAPQKKEERILRDGDTLPYEFLKAGKDYPTNLDTNKKEAYLNDSDFTAVFKMSRSEFEKLPKWKKDSVKKSVGLF